VFHKRLGIYLPFVMIKQLFRPQFKITSLIDMCKRAMVVKLATTKEVIAGEVITAPVMEIGIGGEVVDKGGS